MFSKQHLQQAALWSAGLEWSRAEHRQSASIIFLSSRKLPAVFRSLAHNAQDRWTRTRGVVEDDVRGGGRGGGGGVTKMMM